jgi:hypothetical protein
MSSHASSALRYARSAFMRLTSFDSMGSYVSQAFLYKRCSAQGMGFPDIRSRRASGP